MKHHHPITPLSDLALQYGTINKEQLKQLRRLKEKKRSAGEAFDEADLMLGQHFATQYQVGLLKLIQEYQIIRKQGEAFGRIAVKNGMASPEDVTAALERQKQEFRRARQKKLIGDILVESRVITEKQKNHILNEQTSLDREAEKILDDPIVRQERKDSGKTNEALSEYEKQFLKIKVLDQEFAASVVEKKIASKKEVIVAQKIQEDEFEKNNVIRYLGDIMVELNLISETQKNQILSEQNRLDGEKSKDHDAGIRIEISPDRMVARVVIDEPETGLVFKDVKQKLKQKGICFGIFPDTIIQCCLDRNEKSFLAARQDYSTQAIKDRKTAFHFDPAAIGSEEIRKGAPLAEQARELRSHVKKDIFGDNVEQATGYDDSFRCSAGTRLSKDRTKAFAAKSGVPSLSIDKKLYIHPVINVLEDADLKYGPLESFANLNISGILTGAYPVTAGNLTAREIRGARIEAIGQVASLVGITESIISSQGDVRARYVHGSTIYAFGNVYIENEIIDSRIYCSGRIESENCRIISSDLFGKQGVTLAGAGNERTRPCVIAAGTEDHLFEVTRNILSSINRTRQPLDVLREEKNEKEGIVRKTFQKMVELKLFHDRAKKKKESLSKEFDEKKTTYPKDKLKNIATLVNSFQKRMDATIASLKELNAQKKIIEKEKTVIENKIDQISPAIEKKIRQLEMDFFAFYEWARKTNGSPLITLKGAVFPGTVLKGPFSRLETETTLAACQVKEEKDISKNGKCRLTVTKS